MDVVAAGHRPRPARAPPAQRHRRRRPAVHHRGRTGATTRVSTAETLEQAAEMVDYDTFRKEQAAARDEGRLLGIGLGLYVEPSGLAIGSLSSEAATVSIDPERPGAGGHEQRQPRPERRDDRRPGRGRRARRRLRRRHGHPGRHGGGTVRPGHRRQPQRGAVQRGGAARRRPRCAARSSRSPPTRWRRRPRTSRSTADASRWPGTPARGIDRRRGRPHRLHRTRPSCRRAWSMGLEAQARYTPKAPFTWSNSCHACIVRGRRRSPVPSRCCGSSSARTAA